MQDLAKIEVLDKKMQTVTADEIIKKVLDGEVDALKVEVYLKSLENTISQVRKTVPVKDAIFDEATKYGKFFSVWGADAQLRYRKYWDYGPFTR